MCVQNDLYYYLIIHSVYDCSLKSIHREIYIDRENAPERCEYVMSQAVPEGFLSFQSSEKCRSKLCLVNGLKMEAF